MDLFGNCDVSITLSEVTVKSFRGIFDQSNEVVSPYESDRLVARPIVSVLDSDFEGTTSAHVLLIKLDREAIGKDYKFDGKPRPDSAGLTIIHLAEKK